MVGMHGLVTVGLDLEERRRALILSAAYMRKRRERRAICQPQRPMVCSQAVTCQGARDHLEEARLTLREEEVETTFRMTTGGGRGVVHRETTAVLLGDPSEVHLEGQGEVLEVRAVGLTAPREALEVLMVQRVPRDQMIGC
jgi:hypothetical protein